MSIFQKINTRSFYGRPRQQNSNDSNNESVDSLEHSDPLDDSSYYEEESLASDSDSSSNSDDGSDTEIIGDGETKDTNNEGNETQNEDDMDGIDVQSDQESGPAQIESEWNDTVTAVPRAFPFGGKEQLVQPADTRQVWPIDIFELFVTDEVVDCIVAETNRYASQVIDSQTVTRK